MKHVRGQVGTGGGVVEGDIGGWDAVGEGTKGGAAAAAAAKAAAVAAVAATHTTLTRFHFSTPLFSSILGVLCPLRSVRCACLCSSFVVTTQYCVTCGRGCCGSGFDTGFP